MLWAPLNSTVSAPPPILPYLQVLFVGLFSWTFRQGTVHKSNPPFPFQPPGVWTPRFHSFKMIKKRKDGTVFFNNGIITY